MAYQSLYRRYRSQRFSELRGQAHVTSALKAAVANNRVGHAYLFSGPRGTGKTSTARILAKALNCENVSDGEPCCECESCLAIEQGRSFDVLELDAASNNKVDDIRELISKVHLGSPGQTKVYILDEVHMLSAGAENALLKTLEEPPDHVVFVLATTEPHKVVQTIRSRTQPFDFHLLPADELDEHVRFVIKDAGLDVDEDAIEYVLRQGGGSARDTLSALDLVAAAGGIPAGSDVGFALATAIGDNDPQAAVAALQEALTNGQEPRVIGEATIDALRGAFLAVMGASLDHLNDTAQRTAADLGSRLGAAKLTRALEAIGTALVDMRQAPDPRVPLEVTLLQLSRSEAQSGGPQAADGGGESTGAGAADASLVAELTARISALEQQLAAVTEQLAGGAVATVQGGTDDGGGGTNVAAAARNRLAAATAKPPRSPRAKQAKASTADEPTPDKSTPAPTEPAGPTAESTAESTVDSAPPANEPATNEAAAPGRALSVGDVTRALETTLDDVSQKARVRFHVGEVSNVDGANVIMAVPNSHYVDRCNEVKAEVETALSSHFGQPVTFEIVVNQAAPPATLDPAKLTSTPRPAADDSMDDVGPVEDLADATDQSTDGVERLTKAFPGSTVVEPKPE